MVFSAPPTGNVPFSLKSSPFACQTYRAALATEISKRWQVWRSHGACLNLVIRKKPSFFTPNLVLGTQLEKFWELFFSKVLFILSNIERVCVVSRVWAVITDQGPKTPSFLSIPNCRCIRRTRWRLEHGGIHGTKTNKPSQKKMVFVNKSIEKKPTESQFFGDLF